MGRIKKMNSKIFAKIIFSIFSALLFLFLSQIKFAPILGTKMQFSLAVFIGPTLAKILGISLGTFTIVLTHILGIALKIYKLKSASDIFTFFPIIFGGVYFARIFKKDKKIVFLPLLCILLFILHPIGRSVWFYSLFWLIPLILTFFPLPKLNLFSNSLASAFVDHAVGSVIYLYLLNIPAHFWIEAIPHTIFERIFIAGGISLCYLFEKEILKVLVSLPAFAKIKVLVFE